jgi:large subunit ribosomal protein L23
MKRNPYQILEKPIVTEKSVDVKERHRTLCFKVHADASKVEIKEAVQTVFKVKVSSVHTSTYAGKMRRRGRTFGFRPDWKKAYVKLKPGEKVPEYVENA